MLMRIHTYPGVCPVCPVCGRNHLRLVLRRGQQLLLEDVLGCEEFLYLLGGTIMGLTPWHGLLDGEVW